MNREIIPACMPKRFDDIADFAAAMYRDVKTIQLDLMDGKYVPEKTWPFIFENDYHLDDLKGEDLGFPFWEEVNYELDLMVERPELSINSWMNIGASRVIFHYASVHDWEVIKNIDHGIRNFVQIGIAVTIHDNLDDIYPLIDEKIVDFVQVMGIAQIGYMGEPFAEECLDVIVILKKKYPDLIISIDGGVSEYTIPALRDVGISRFVSGSGISGHGIPRENVVYLRNLAEGEEIE